MAAAQPPVNWALALKWSNDLTISKNIILFKKTRNIIYLIRAIKLIIIQGRLLEVTWSLICYIIFKPSQIIELQNDNKIVDKIKDLVGTTKADGFSREDLIKMFEHKYSVNDIPEDFYFVRAESVIEIGRFLVLGEYVNNSARLLFLTNRECEINYFYNNMKGVLHIHSIHKDVVNNNFLVSTGDSAKILDRWGINLQRVYFKTRIKKRMAGYTAAAQVKGIDYFGTDFSSRPNYIETLDGDKYPFPKLAFKMYAISMDSYENRYLYIISKQLNVVGTKVCLSIFDIDKNSFIYCDHLNIQLTGYANLELPHK